MESVSVERDAAQGKGLRAGALGLLSSVVIAVSSTAPAYSLAATLGLVVAIVGVHSPGTMIVSFLPMLCIAYAFRELNKVDPDCGTTFTWTTRAFGPWAGWMGGWGIIAADIIVMASLSQIAGHYALLLLGAGGAASSTLWVTLVGVVFIAALTWVCYRGIEVSARLQQALLAIELIALGVFAVMAFVKAGTGHALPGAGHVSAAWLSPWTGSFRSLSDSFLLAVFVYWGWDCAVSVNEETEDRARTPGRAAVISTVVLVAVFAVVAVACLVFAGPAFLAQHATTCSAPCPAWCWAAPAGQAADPVRADLGDRVDPDHDHADGPGRAVHGRAPGAARAVRPDAPALPDAHRGHGGHGHGLRGVLRGADAGVEECSGRLGPRRSGC